MIESITESLHGLLAEGSGLDSGSDSSRGSHHHSWECFLAETSEGHVESVSIEETTPTGILGGITERGTVAPPHVGVEQLRARKREMDEAGQQLVWEYVEVDEEIRHRGDGGHARAVAHDVNRKIIADGETVNTRFWSTSEDNRWTRIQEEGHSANKMSGRLNACAVGYLRRW